MESDPKPTPNVVLMMASIIAAVRTAKLADREFQGMKSPAYESAISKSLTIARSIWSRANKGE